MNSEKQLDLFPRKDKQIIIHGDCLVEMAKMEANSIDFIVTDPPYGLHFMGKQWDKDLPNIAIWKEALRICKPGAMLAAFGGSRTYHRLMCALEDAGFEIRDVIIWLYGSGFPKSHNNFGLKGYGTALKPAYEPIIICEKPYEIISLFITILLDITNEIYICQKSNYNVKDVETNLNDSLLLLDKVLQFTAQDHAKIIAWEKLLNVEFVLKNITSLKQELIERINQVKDLFALMNAKQNSNNNIQDQKILHGEAECIFASIQDIVTFVTMEHIEQNIVSLWKNILIGIFQGMNKFTTRTVINLITELKILKSCLHPIISNDTGNLNPKYEPIILAMKPLEGTYAKNVEKWGIGGINIDESRIFHNEKCKIKKKQENINSIIRQSGRFKDTTELKPNGRWPANIILDEEAGMMLDEQSGNLLGAGNKSGASRFFYCAKASSKERNEGLEGMPIKQTIGGGGTNNTEDDVCGKYGSIKAANYNHHPTVKPIALMKYIIKLLTPPNNPILLDPFAGSGSTLIAAKELGINAIGIEMNEEYCEIAKKRIENH